MRIRYSRYILNLFLVTVFLTLCSLVFALSVYADDGSGSTKTNPDENAYISGGNINEKGNNDAQVDESVLTNPDVLKSGESVSPENNEQINNQTLSSPSGVPEKIEKAADGKLYYIDSTGKRKTSAGWIYFDGKKYFASPGGSLYTNQMITFGSYGYYMGSDGSVLLGHFRGADGVYRYADAAGNLEDESYGKLAAVGWREDNYFAHGGYGELYHNQFITFGDKIYYMTGDGSVAKSKFQFMKGVIINPGPTGLISLSEYNYYLPQISAMQSARSILKQIGNSLWAAYKWAGSAITYKNMTTDADKGISYFANIAFNQRSGNCYTMASAFYYMALSLGYDVYQVSGFHQGRYKEWPHSWCEIRQNGGTYIYDPDILKEMDREIYGRKYGESGTLKYLVSKNKYMKL